MLAIVFIGCHRTPPSSLQGLEHFDGAVDLSDTTDNSAKSALYIRAMKHLEDEELESAKSLYRRAIKMYPDDPEGYASLASCFCFDNEYAEAKRQYQRALDVDSDCVNAHYGLGCVAYEKREHTAAEQHLQRAIAIDARRGDSHRVLSMVYEQLGELGKARYHSEQASKLNATDR